MGRESTPAAQDAQAARSPASNCEQPWRWDIRCSPIRRDRQTDTRAPELCGTGAPLSGEREILTQRHKARQAGAASERPKGVAQLNDRSSSRRPSRASFTIPSCHSERSAEVAESKNPERLRTTTPLAPFCPTANLVETRAFDSVFSLLCALWDSLLETHAQNSLIA
jgi:hypothetical protein